MNPLLVLAMLASVLFCTYCQSRDASNAVNSMEESSLSHSGVDVESLGYVVSGPMSMVIEPSALSHIKQAD